MSGARWLNIMPTWPRFNIRLSVRDGAAVAGTIRSVAEAIDKLGQGSEAGSMTVPSMCHSFRPLAFAA